MRRIECALKDRKGLAVERLRLLVSALRFVEHGQVVHRHCNIRMAGSEKLPLDPERLLVLRLGLAQSALGLVKGSQIVQVDSDVIAVGAVAALKDSYAAVVSL